MLEFSGPVNLCLNSFRQNKIHSWELQVSSNQIKKVFNLTLKFQISDNKFEMLSWIQAT